MPPGELLRRQNFTSYPSTSCCLFDMASYVKAASDNVESGAKSVAESVRGTLGDTVADAIKTGGEYGKSGITATGNALGFKEGAGQDSADAATSNLSGAGEQLKGAAKDTQAAFSEAGNKAQLDAQRNKDGAKAEAQSNYDAAVQNTKSAYESAKQSTANALNQGADKLQSK